MTRIGVVAIMLLLAGCQGVQSPLAPGGDQATALHNLFLLMMAVCGGIYALVLVGLGWSLRRVRSAGQAAEVPERSLWGAAIVIVIGLTVLIVGSFVADRAVFASRRQGAMMVRVTGHQWWWRIEYRDSATGRWIETANELHLPLDRTTRVALGSADVIHSFWVPNVAGKLDMIPGRRNVLDLTPRRVGWFRGQCAEFCGTQHAHMALDVKVESAAAFEAWLTEQARPAPSPASRGAAVFANACAVCHAIRGTGASGRVGPDLTHLASRKSIAAGTLTMTRGNLQGWITQPQALKPGTSMPAVPLSGPDADALAAYMESLK